MNQQQKKYTIARMHSIALAYVKRLDVLDRERKKEYIVETTLNIQDLLANDRAILNAMQPKEGQGIDDPINRTLTGLFDLSEYEKQKADLCTLAPPLDKSVSVSFPDNGLTTYFHYQDLADMAKACVKELQEATDQIMIGSDADALEAIKIFSAHFAK